MRGLELETVSSTTFIVVEWTLRCMMSWPEERSGPGREKRTKVFLALWCNSTHINNWEYSSTLKNLISLFLICKGNDILSFPWYPCVWCLLSILYCCQSQLYLLQIDFILLLKYSWRKVTLKRDICDKTSRKEGGVPTERGHVMLQKLLFRSESSHLQDRDLHLGWSWWTVHSPPPEDHLCGAPQRGAGSSQSHSIFLELIFVFHFFFLVFKIQIII